MARPSSDPGQGSLCFEAAPARTPFEAFNSTHDERARASFCITVLSAYGSCRVLAPCQRLYFPRGDHPGEWHETAEANFEVSGLPFVFEAVRRRQWAQKLLATEVWRGANEQSPHLEPPACEGPTRLSAFASRAQRTEANSFFLWPQLQDLPAPHLAILFMPDRENLAFEPGSWDGSKFNVGSTCSCPKPPHSSLWHEVCEVLWHRGGNDSSELPSRDIPREVRSMLVGAPWSEDVRCFQASR